MENISYDYDKLLSQSEEGDNHFFLKANFWLVFST